MINLMQKGLPDTVLIGGELFSVHTDFRIWMRFCQNYETWDRREDLDIAFVFAGIVPCIRTAEDMGNILKFAYPPSVVPKDSGEGSARILDYEIDSDYIYSAFLGQYGIDLAETDMHWHKFRALLRGLNDSTRLHEIMGYRCYEGKDKELLKLRNAWEIPVKITEEEHQAKEEFDNYFG